MRVLIIDRHPVFREGLKKIMEADPSITIAGEADSCRNMRGTAIGADLIIMDGELDSLDLLRWLQKTRPRHRPPFVLVLAMRIEQHHAVQMLKAGADGYLCKSDPAGAVLEAIRAVAKGIKYVPSTLAETVIYAMNGVNGDGRLSNREYEVLYLFGSGMRMTEIAHHLSISIKTVSTYRSRLLDKLNLKSNVELMRYAFSKGMVS